LPGLPALLLLLLLLSPLPVALLRGLADLAASEAVTLGLAAAPVAAAAAAAAAPLTFTAASPEAGVAGGLLVLPLLLSALLPPMPVVLLLLLLLLKPSAVLVLRSVVVVSGCGMPAGHNAQVPAANTAVSRIEYYSCMYCTSNLSSDAVGKSRAARCSAAITL
jgi:hypothetical protein